MNLKEKYSTLIRYAEDSKIDGLNITDEGNVLRISGTASPEVRDKMWDIYNELDPDMRSGDVVLNVISNGEKAQEESYEVKEGDNLSRIAAKYPSMSWQKIFDANRDILQDPDKIYPGQVLKIPVE